MKNLHRLDRHTIRSFAAGFCLVLIALGALDAASQPAPVRLEATPASLSFAVPVGGPDPFPVRLRISAGDNQPRPFQVVDDAGWLLLDPAGGTTPAEIAASVHVGSLPAQTYLAAILVSSPGVETLRIPVALVVTSAGAGGARLTVSPSSLSATTRQGADPSPRSLSIGSSGGPLPWSAGTSGAFLSISPSSGNTPGSVSVNFRAFGLAPGTYSGNVTVRASGSPAVVVPVTLTIQSP